MHLQSTGLQPQAPDMLVELPYQLFADAVLSLQFAVVVFVVGDLVPIISFLER